MKKTAKGAQWNTALECQTSKSLASLQCFIDRHFFKVCTCFRVDEAEVLKFNDNRGFHGI